MRHDLRRALPRRAVLLVALLALGAAAATRAEAAGDEALWTLLKGGGQVVLIRHAITTPGVGDPPGMRLEECSTQRNLTDAGRAHARRVGEAFRARKIVVDRVMSSPWCRCLETARLAFGPPEVWTALSNLFDRQQNRTEQVGQMQAFIGGLRRSGIVVLVSHGSTISALTGINPEPAEMVVATPQGGTKFTVAGRLAVR
jgi:phosphohistidine phosphatase SixA